MSAVSPGEGGLTLRGVGHAYDGRPVVADVDLDVARGEIVCLLGPSGSGKSTLLRLIAGLERLETGEIAFDGHVLADARGSLPPEKRGVGLLFQDFALFPHLTVYENVAFGLSHLPRAERRRRAMEELGRVRMAAFADRPPHTLSGGEQQRVALARASAARPGIMLLDEPFSNLDVEMRFELRRMVRDLLKASTAASIVVTHDPEEAMFMGDRIAVIQDGRIVQVGTPDGLYAAPATSFIAGMFGDLNKFDGVVVAGHVQTPVGRFCTPHLAEGTGVEVLIRPEGFRLDRLVESAEEVARGTVLNSRLMGRSRLVRLSCDCADAPALLLDARVPASVHPIKDEVVNVRLDLGHAFVFPTERG